MDEQAWIAQQPELLEYVMWPLYFAAVGYTAASSIVALWQAWQKGKRCKEVVVAMAKCLIAVVVFLCRFSLKGEDVLVLAIILAGCVLAYDAFCWARRPARVHKSHSF